MWSLSKWIILNVCVNPKEKKRRDGPTKWLGNRHLFIEKKNEKGLLKTRINNDLLDMQLNIGIDVILIPRNFWKELIKQRLKKSYI